MEPTGRINCRSQEAASRSRYRPLGVPSPAGRTAARGAEDDYARPADPEIRFVHIAAVIASGSLFFIPGWRWSAGNRGARWCRSVAPVLLIIVAIAGLAFGNDAAEGAIVRQLGGSMGDATATAIEEMIKNAADRSSGTVASIVGVVALVVTATGVFGEVQSALNAIWKAKPRSSTLNRLVRARLASLGLVVTCGFLLTVSLAVSAALGSLSRFLKGLFPDADLTLQAFDFLVSTALISALFAAIYKVLPDRPITWRDVAIGAVITTLLFDAGKYLIALYIGQSNVASAYGAAGGLIVLLLWIYYTAQIFLFGAEFTHAYAERFGSHAGAADAPLTMKDRPPRRPHGAANPPRIGI